MTVQHYIFGYGSLICSASRALSAPTLATRNALPVRIRNVVRAWNKRSTQSGATYLGVQKVLTARTCNNRSSNSGCVGVLIPLDATHPETANQELEALDDREMGYDRHAVPLEWIDRVDNLLSRNPDNLVYEGTFLAEDFIEQNVSPLSSAETNSQTSTAAVWMYVPQVSEPANGEYPIAQSYVDICVRGCLSISEAFLQEFITSTVGWDPQDLVSWEEENRTNRKEEEHEIDDNDMDTIASSEGWYCHDRCHSSSLSSSFPSSTSSCSDFDFDDDDEELSSSSFSPTSNPEAWINDRQDPLYMRADKAFSLRYADQIDSLVLAAMTEMSGNFKNENSSLKVAVSNSHPSNTNKVIWNILRVTRGKKELQSTIRNRKLLSQHEQAPRGAKFSTLRLSFMSAAVTPFRGISTQ